PAVLLPPGRSSLEDDSVVHVPPGPRIEGEDREDDDCREACDLRIPPGELQELVRVGLEHARIRLRAEEGDAPSKDLPLLSEERARIEKGVRVSGGQCQEARKVRAGREAPDRLLFLDASGEPGKQSDREQQPRTFRHRSPWKSGTGPTDGS